MANIVIIYGAGGVGKTRDAHKYLAHFKCTRLVDGWDGRALLRDGDLALTQQEPPFPLAGRDVHIFDASAAKSAVRG